MGQTYDKSANLSLNLAERLHEELLVTARLGKEVDGRPLIQPASSVFQHSQEQFAAVLVQLYTAGVSLHIVMDIRLGSTAILQINHTQAADTTCTPILYICIPI